MNYLKLFNDYQIPFTTKVNKGWVNVRCPFCSDIHTCGGFNISKNYYNCWICGSHDWREALKKILVLDNASLNRLLSIYADTDEKFQKINNIKHSSLPYCLDLPTDTFSVEERKYLRDRNFSPSFLHRKYGIVGGGKIGKWNNRIIIPFYYNGRLVSWTGRSIFDNAFLEKNDLPRYKNLSVGQSIMNPKHIFFNLDNSPGRDVALAEGPFDVLRMGDNFISGFGIDYTEEQLFLLHRRFDRVFILFDNEAGAQAKAKKIGISLVSMGLDVEIIDAYADYGVKDAGDLADDDALSIRRELGFKKSK